MAAASTWEVVRFCFAVSGRRSRADAVAALCARTFSLLILAFNVFFGLMLKDANLLIRGVPTLILLVPLLCLYVRARRAVLVRTTTNGGGSPGEADPMRRR